MLNDEELRQRAFDLENKEFLITKFSGSTQSSDITLKEKNCDDFGRVHHFKYNSSSRWVPNPLPHQPVSKFFNMEVPDILQVQVFQLAVCNFNCWYCFVDKNLRSADLKHSAMVSAERLLSLVKSENRPRTVVLSGGQPELVPEYQLWFLEARKKLGMENSHFIWSDDNLSNDFFWTKLSDSQKQFMLDSKGYARVACLKGYDADSFAFNTGMPKPMFQQQIHRLARLHHAGFDQYGYITLTGLDLKAAQTNIPKLIDQIQKDISETFPLRIAPLEIFKYNVNANAYHEKASENQYRILDIWCSEIDRRFSSNQRNNALSKSQVKHER